MKSSTIAALATAPSPAGVAVIRISGPDSLAIAQQVFNSKSSLSEPPRMMLFGSIINPLSKERIDSGMAVYMPAPKSFTGEDVVELHTHGSPAVIKEILRTLYFCGATPAQPGEFSKRAFLNGRNDLAQAEAIAGLINSSSERSAKRAQEQLSGRLSSALDKIGEPLRDLLAEIEASIDFPEEDIAPDKVEQMLESLKKAVKEISLLISSYQYGHRIRDGLRILLCGRPNVGKSSLMNRLLEKERAIVTPISGTTRDLIEEELSIEGYKVVLCDSAGVRTSDDLVETRGIELTKERITWADLVLCIVNATDTEDDWREILQELNIKDRSVWLIVNKIDLHSVEAQSLSSIPIQKLLPISALNGSGIALLKEALVNHIESLMISQDACSVVITEERHRSLLVNSNEALLSAAKLLETAQPLELASTDIREAINGLDEIIGRTYTEDILGRIFSKFCIGK